MDIETLVLETCKGRSKSNPLTRNELRDITKMSDRGSRKVIENLRDEGYRIINDSTGYWYSTDESEYRSWLNLYSSYAYTILNRIKAMNNFTEGQVGIGEI